MLEVFMIVMAVLFIAWLVDSFIQDFKDVKEGTDLLLKGEAHIEKESSILPWEPTVTKIVRNKPPEDEEECKQGDKTMEPELVTVEIKRSQLAPRDTEIHLNNPNGAKKIRIVIVEDMDEYPGASTSSIPVRN